MPELKCRGIFALLAFLEIVLCLSHDCWTDPPLLVGMNRQSHNCSFPAQAWQGKKLLALEKELKAIYDYHSDMRDYKWSGKEKLEKCDISELPEYLVKNKDKYSIWLK